MDPSLNPGSAAHSLCNTTQGIYLPCLSRLGCHDKIPRIRWFKQQTFISHSSRGREVQVPGVGPLGSWLAESHLPTVSSEDGESSGLFLFS